MTVHKTIIPHTLLTFLFSLCLIATAYSQCPTTSRSNDHWRQNSTVYYTIYNIEDPLIKSQILSAIGQWAQESQQNGTNIVFAEGTPPNGASTSTPYLEICLGAGTNNGYPAGCYDSLIQYSTGCIVESQITFYTELNYYNESGPGYDTVFLKGMLHELGHEMGLDDVLDVQEDGASVMNSPIGVNEYGENCPTSIQPCDKNALASDDSPYAPRGGSSGAAGHNNGTGTSTGTPCTHTYMYIYDWVEFDLPGMPGAWYLSEIIDLGCLSVI